MAYTKTNWTSSTPINTTNLNKIENGISENDTNKLDKTSVKTTKTSSGTDTYSCNYINNISQRQIIGVQTSSKFDFVLNNYTEINTWSEHVKVGDKFSVVNGKVKVGSGVSKVKISITMSINMTDEDTIYAWPKINGVSVGPWIIQRSPGAFVMCVTTLGNVKENDLISIAVYSTKAADIDVNRGYMIVEAIE